MFFKEQKEYSRVVFVLFLMIFLVLGALTWVPAEQVGCQFIHPEHKCVWLANEWFLYGQCLREVNGLQSTLWMPTP